MSNNRSFYGGEKKNQNLATLNNYYQLSLLTLSTKYGIRLLLYLCVQRIINIVRKLILTALNIFILNNKTI